jgi:SNF2 family DNA or RNA helicase
VSFEYKTVPYTHQAAEFPISREMEARCVFWVPRAGKSKLIIDTAAWLYHLTKINGLLIVAPNGPHENWFDFQIPEHLHENVPREMLVYKPKSLQTLRYEAAFERLLRYDGLAIFVMNYDAFIKRKGESPGNAAARKFLKKRRCLYVIDESHKIKTPSAKRTMAILWTAHLAPYRRLLTGTPTTQGPFDIYSQMKFYDPFFWHGCGLSQFGAFKAQYGVFKKGWNPHTGKEFDDCVGYKNVAHLRAKLRPHISRVTEADLDMPPKVYTPYYFDLSPKQRKMYDTLRQKYRVELEEYHARLRNASTDVEFRTRHAVTARAGVTRVLRLQQIACGHVPTDWFLTTQGTMKRKQLVFEKNPRRELLRELLSNLDHPAVVWCKFRPCIDICNALMDDMGRPFVTVDGRVPVLKRRQANQAFQFGEGVDTFVGTPATAGEGIDLWQGLSAFYYSNSYKLVEREQSEQRLVRVGKKSPVNIGDLIARETVDELILMSLQEKQQLAAELTGDNWKRWFE